MNRRGHDERELGLWHEIGIRLVPTGLVLVVLGASLGFATLFVAISADLRVNLVAMCLSLSSVGLGLIAIGVSAESDIRYWDTEGVSCLRKKMVVGQYGGVVNMPFRQP